MNRAFRACLVPVLVSITLAGPGDARGASDAPAPHAFVANRGQLDDRVRFHGTSSRAAVFFTDHGPVVELREFVPSEEALPGLTVDLPTRSREQRSPGSMRRFAVGIRFAGASGRMRVEPVGDPVGPQRRFIGAGGATGSREVPAYEGVAYRGVWPGVDVVYTADEQGLRYEIVVEPGAESPRVAFEYEGATSVEAAEGATRLATPLGTIVDRRISDRRPRGRLEWGSARADRLLAVAPPAPPSQSIAAAVTSDVLSWGTFLGGARDEAVYAVAVDDQNRPIVTGATRSADFPTTLGTLDTTFGGSFDVFVAQLSADGTQVLWSTYIGGPGDDRGWAVELDGAGRPVVAGITSGTGFPTTVGAHDETPNGLYDAFVLKLAADGSSLLWSTLFGGSESEWDVSGLAMDSLGRPLVAGSTRSDDLPVGPLAYDSTLAGTSDAFVARFAGDGSALEYATYLGGSGDDAAEDLTVTAAGSAVVVGRSTSTDFPVTPGALQPFPDPPSQDGFASALSVDGGALQFGTYLGGTGDDEPFAVALDAAERIVIAGRTSSTDFPTTPATYLPSPAGADDAFVTKIAADGTAIIWGTYFGGSGPDRALALAADGSRGLVLAGWTCSEDLPLTPNAFSAEYMGPCEAFLSRLADDGSRLDYSSYLGGWRDDSAFGVALDGLERLIVGGTTWSTDFPVTPASYDPLHNSPDTWEDGFVMAIGAQAVCTAITVGAEGPELQMSKAADGACPPMAPLAAGIDLIQGRLESLSPSDIGDVDPIVCGSLGAMMTTVSVPGPGSGLFLLARLTAGGSYTDAGGSGLTGARLPLSGDCP